MSTLRDINEYLFYDFGPGLEEDEHRISDDWPFVLDPVGSFPVGRGTYQVYRFTDDGDAFYVLDGPALLSVPADGMTLEDLRREQQGGSWIAQGDPVDLNTSRIGDERVPPAPERRAAIVQLARNLVNVEAPIMHEGLFLMTGQTYLALVEDPTTGQEYVLSSEWGARPSVRPDLRAYRRLALTVGLLLDRGEVSWPGGT
jgi:hypothetical protein